MRNKSAISSDCPGFIGRPAAVLEAPVTCGWYYSFRIPGGVLGDGHRQAEGQQHAVHGHCKDPRACGGQVQGGRQVFASHSHRGLRQHDQGGQKPALSQLLGVLAGHTEVPDSSMRVHEDWPHTQ
eukprot:2149051-Pyramimonas_sp.AAC.1